ncbi:MAG TPA: hypothetical protein VMH61_03820 [Candidatus Acidoferrales bacterium]|nr:hypothetical protein [Candidatus Acidoferrales bacterium]
MAQIPPLGPPVAEIERRLKWRVLPTIGFVAMLLALLALAEVSLMLAHRHPHGLPDDADAHAVAAALAGRVSSATGELRWRAAVLGGEPGRDAPDAASVALLAAARPALEAARRRHRDDPRALAALAALDLERHAYDRAAGRYRHACELAPHYGEGRLGAGVALALEADVTSEPWQSRALRLQAIAQFAMVDSIDAEYPLALYDRVLSLRAVGRPAEASFWAARYLACDDSSRWAKAMRRS